MDKLKNIDVINLFKFGADVPWPATGQPGFLSSKHCPNLWSLGARVGMEASEAMSLIEKIITCINVYSSRPSNMQIVSSQKRPNAIYINAYNELLQYLTQLFIFYDKQMTTTASNYENWPWFEFLKYCYNSENYSDIIIVTFNYDLWLERILINSDLKFEVGIIGNNNPSAKIKLFKPHGSISFLHKEKNDKDSYQIRYKSELLDGGSTDFQVAYEDLDENYLVCAMIPPAGDASRFNQTWAGQVQSEMKAKASSLQEGDELIFCGLSYWHVDRSEVDSIINSCHPSVDVSMVNPKPPHLFDAVLTSTFSNYIAYTSSDSLMGKIR